MQVSYLMRVQAHGDPVNLSVSPYADATLPISLPEDWSLQRLDLEFFSIQPKVGFSWHLVHAVTRSYMNRSFAPFDNFIIRAINIEIPEGSEISGIYNLSK